MKIRLLLMAAWLAATFFVVLSPVDTAGAGRFGGGRGGGGFSRSGPAAQGGFAGGASQRTARTATRQAGASERSGQRAATQQQRMTERSDLRTNRQDEITERQGQRQETYSERQENRQDYRSEAREDWQDAANNWDNRYYRYPAGAAVATGAVVAAGAYAAGRAASSNVTYVTTLPCSPTTAYLNGVTYYRCGSDWYTRAYAGGSVSYTVVSPPPGY